MMGHTHFTFGALFATFAVTHNYAEPSVAFFAGALIGSLAPDLDHPQAMLSRKVPMSGMTIGRLRHRTLTHSLFGVALVYALGKFVIPPVWSYIWQWILTNMQDYQEVLLQTQQSFAGFVGPGFLYGFIVGYISHIVIDLLNPMGVQLFYPLDFLPNRGWVHLPFGLGIRTGTIWELGFALLSLIGATFYDPKMGGITAIMVIVFWLLLGKPGIPRYKIW